MVQQTTGSNATEFDRTTDAILHTIQALGVTDEQVLEDQNFLVDLFAEVSVQTVEGIEPIRTIEVLDCAFIGLLYHRHMPFRDTEGETFYPERSPNDYIFTLNALSSGVVDQLGVSKVSLLKAGAEGALLARSHMRDDLVEDDLGMQFLALSTLGMIVHRLVPFTREKPVK